MKDKMQRFKYGFYTFILLGAVFAANQIDKMHFETAQHSLDSIYEDRVVAQDIIYQLSSTFNDRHLLYIADSSHALTIKSFQQQNKTIDNLLVKFKNTVLTSEEVKQLRQLEHHFQLLQKDERNWVDSSPKDLQKIKRDFLSINKNLDVLSEIQLTESRNLKALGQKSLDSNYLMSLTEIVLMIFVTGALLISIFYKGSEGV